MSCIEMKIEKNSVAEDTKRLANDAREKNSPVLLCGCVRETPNCGSAMKIKG
jgi:hypothetical protein